MAPLQLTFEVTQVTTLGLSPPPPTTSGEGIKPNFKNK